MPGGPGGLCDVDDPKLKDVQPGHWAAFPLITADDYQHIRAGEDDLAVVAEDDGETAAAEGGETA